MTANGQIIAASKREAGRQFFELYEHDGELRLKVYGCDDQNNLWPLINIGRPTSRYEWLKDNYKLDELNRP